MGQGRICVSDHAGFEKRGKRNNNQNVSKMQVNIQFRKGGGKGKVH